MFKFYECVLITDNKSFYYNHYGYVIDFNDKTDEYVVRFNLSSTLGSIDKKFNYTSLVSYKELYNKKKEQEIQDLKDFEKYAIEQEKPVANS